MEDQSPQKDFLKLEQLFKQKLDSVIKEVKNKGKEASHQLLSSNTCYQVPPQGSNESENFNKEHPVGDNYDGNTSHSMMLNNLKVSKYLSMSKNKENADSNKLFINSYRFAIDMKDKILLYDKDPRLRIHLGSKVKLLNKFRCLQNNDCFEREI